MRFGAVPVAEAVGAVLAHSHAVPSGRLRKGRVLTEADVAALHAAGATQVIVAQLSPGDLGEDDAATRVAQALVPDPDAAGLRLNTATTGRVNVYGTGPGVLMVDADAIAAANAVDPMVTIATLPPHALTRDKGMVATVKIISYGVAASAVDEAAALARGGLRVARPVLRDAVLIVTDIGAGPGKGEAAMRGRLAALGMELADVIVVPHAVAPLAASIEAARADMVLILTGSATSDADDVAPAALRAAGGTVERFGMPVDPGNLLFLGQFAGRPVIGLPGCARSPALNGADWVLERVACGIAVTGADIAAMGVGGLLKESPARPHPRETG